MKYSWVWSLPFQNLRDPLTISQIKCEWGYKIVSYVASIYRILIDTTKENNVVNFSVKDWFLEHRENIWYVSLKGKVDQAYTDILVSNKLSVWYYNMFTFEEFLVYKKTRLG